MFLPIRGMYLKEVRTLLFVKMLILNLQSPSRSISANKVSLPAIIVVSLDTSGHTVLKSDISSLGSGKQSKRQVSLALNLPSPIMLFGNNGIILKGILPYAVTVVSMATPKLNASKWSLISPRRIRPMKSLSTWWRVSLSNWSN
jgi:hypothetical protein